MKSLYKIGSYFFYYLGDIVCRIMEHTRIYSLYWLYNKLMNKSVSLQKGNDGPWNVS